MKHTYACLFLTCTLALLLAGCRTAKSVKSDAKPVSHEIWNDLLQKHVATDGAVNYKGFIQDSTLLNDYLAILTAGHPNEANWTRNEQLAYWINAYNAFTIQIVIRNYPVASIKDIAGAIPFVNSVWDLKFIEIEGVVYDLNNIEHNLIRKIFEEPRIHFALVCASYSCPALRNEAFVADKLEVQLTEQAQNFINDPRKNRIENKDQAELSKIFSWYSGDFKTNTTLIEFINQYADTQLSEDAEIEYIDYDWSLNE